MKNALNKSCLHWNWCCHKVSGFYAILFFCTTEAERLILEAANTILYEMPLYLIVFEANVKKKSLSHHNYVSSSLRNLLRPKVLSSRTKPNIWMSALLFGLIYSTTFEHIWRDAHSTFDQFMNLWFFHLFLLQSHSILV